MRYLPLTDTDRSAMLSVIGAKTIDDLFSERDDEDKIWGSMVKQALKRRKPGFNETYHGFRSFGKLLEEMASKKMLTMEHDQKSGGYIITAVN